MPLQLEERNNADKHNRIKCPNWREANQLTIYYSAIGELSKGPPRNNSSLVVREGLESVTSTFQVRALTIRPPCLSRCFCLCLSQFYQNTYRLFSQFARFILETDHSSEMTLEKERKFI